MGKLKKVFFIVVWWLTGQLKMRQDCNKLLGDIAVLKDGQPKEESTREVERLKRIEQFEYKALLSTKVSLFVTEAIDGDTEWEDIEEEYNLISHDLDRLKIELCPDMNFESSKKPMDDNRIALVLEIESLEKVIRDLKFVIATLESSLEAATKMDKSDISAKVSVFVNDVIEKKTDWSEIETKVNKMSFGLTRLKNKLKPKTIKKKIHKTTKH